MIDLGPVLVVAISVGALCLIVGADRIGKRLVAGAILVALLLPSLSRFIGKSKVSLAPVGAALGWVLGAILVAALVVAWLAYVAQRRRLAKWREPDRPPLGQKRRIDPE